MIFTNGKPINLDGVLIPDQTVQQVPTNTKIIKKGDVIRPPVAPRQYTLGVRSPMPLPKKRRA